MEDNENFDNVIDNINYNFTFQKTFEFYLDFKSQKKDVQKNLLHQVCSYYISKKSSLKTAQKVLLSKIILAFFKNIEGYQPSQEDENLKNECNENLSEIKNKEYNSELKHIDKLTTEEVILYFIKEVLKYPIHQKEILTPEEYWNENGLHLENFKITEAIRNGLIKFLDENEDVKNYFEEIELKKLLLSKETWILNTIYEFIKFKSIKKRKKRKLKDGGDKERLNDDYGRNQIMKDDSTNKFERSIVLGRQELLTIKKILKGLKMKMTLESYFGKNLIEYYSKDSNNIYKTTDIIEDFEIPERNREVQIYIKYLDFINKIVDYILRYISHITYRTEIILELEPISKGQREEILYEESYRKDLIKDIPEVRCISSFSEIKDNDPKKKITHYYKDDNVLIYGIHGKLQGFIFMINELCNADYENMKKM